MHKEDQIHKKRLPKGFLQRAFVEATGLLLIQPGTADKIRPYKRGSQTGCGNLSPENRVTSLDQLEPCPTRIKPVSLAGADFQT